MLAEDDPMGSGMFGPRTVGQKLRTLIVAAPCLVLAVTSAIGYLFAAHAMKLCKLC